jgi:hypothetical protein
MAKPILTPEIIGDRIEAIRVVAGDSEVAHGMADDLWRDVLEALADRRCEDVTCCAFVALKVDELGFERWCA